MNNNEIKKCKYKDSSGEICGEECVKGDDYCLWHTRVINKSEIRDLKEKLKERYKYNKNFEGFYLPRVNLENLYLMGANFKNSYLERANFSCSNLYAVNFENAKAGSYKIVVKAYLDEEDYLDGNYEAYREISIDIESCKEESGSKEGESKEIIVIEPAEENATETEESIETITGEAISFKETNAYTALLVLANVVVLMILIAVIGKFVVLIRK